MPLVLRSVFAVAAAVFALLVAACSSSDRYDELTPRETYVEVDPVKACGMLVAVPQGLAQQKADEFGCVQTEDGWEHHSAIEPVAAEPVSPASPILETQPGGGIAWDQAANYVGTNQRVCGPLVGNGWDYEDAFLNLGHDYPDTRRFQIVVWDVYELEPINYGSTLCTTGLISLYDGVAQIELWDPTLIEIYY